MASETIEATWNGSVPSYTAQVARNNVGLETRTQMFSGKGAYTGSTQVKLSANNSNPGYYERGEYGDFVFDLRAFKFVTFTAASMTFTSSSPSSYNFWPGNDNAGGMALVGQRETVRSETKSASNYQEIYQGAITPGLEYANRLPKSSFGSGNNMTFTYNAAGISYLNTVKSKSNLRGYALFGWVLGGIVDNVAPTWAAGSHYVRPWGIYPIDINLTFNVSSAHYINIGDSWKQVTGGLLNVGDEWKMLDDIDINVGDVWKNV